MATRLVNSACIQMLTMTVKVLAIHPLLDFQLTVRDYTKLSRCHFQMLHVFIYLILFIEQRIFNLWAIYYQFSDWCR